MLLRSALFNAAFYIWTVGMVILFLPALLLPWQVTVWGQRRWARGVNGLMRVLAGIDVEIRGRENLPAGGCIVASKHQSAWDTIIFSILLWDHSFVLKQELLRIPLFGLYLSRAGLIPVDRQGGSKALRKMVSTARQVAAAGRPIVIFPEGTRVAPDQKLPYHPGVAALYSQLNIPVVPVALNSGLFWRRNSFWKLPGTITLEFLAPIPPGLPRREFLQQLESAIEGRSRALIAESAAEKPSESKTLAKK